MIMQGKRFSKILVAIDGWAPSMHAANYAISRLFGSLEKLFLLVNRSFLMVLNT